MRTYKVKYKLIFEGVVEVRTDEGRQKAKTIARSGFSQPILEVGNNHTWLSGGPHDEGIADWDFDIHAQEIKTK